MDVLIVSRDPHTVELASLICKSAGYRTSIADNGLQALMLLDERSIDLLLAELEDAEFCARALCGPMKMAARPQGQVAILAMANRLDLPAAAALHAQGIAAGIAKPLRTETLRKAILGARRAARWVEIVPVPHHEASDVDLSA